MGKIENQMNKFEDKFHEVTEVLGNTEGRLVAIEDNVSSISSHLTAIENCQKKDNANLQTMVEKGSKMVEEKVVNTVLHLGIKVADLDLGSAVKTSQTKSPKIWRLN